MAFNLPPLYPFYQSSYKSLGSYLARDRRSGSGEAPAGGSGERAATGVRRPLTSPIIYFVRQRIRLLSSLCRRLFPWRILRASFFQSVVCCFLHPISPAQVCVCVWGGATFRRLHRVAGGAGSQSLIYSGSFEIIKLTHLSDGERRNAKRSPGEVPAAPTPNLSCLQIAQSLHHNRWDSAFHFCRSRTQTVRAAASVPHTFTRSHAEVQQAAHKAPTRRANRRRHVLHTAAEADTLGRSPRRASAPHRRSLSASLHQPWF